MSLANNLDNFISEEDYLQGELASEIKHEFIDGDVYAMTEASRKHNTIATNISSDLHQGLKNNKSSCTTFAADMKVKINHNFFYPDVMVVCDPEDNENDYYQKSPVIIVEVLSKSTRKNDTSLKRMNYFDIPSLEEYVLVEQDICQVEVFRKSAHWQASFYFLGDEITFESIGITLSVEDIYYQIDTEEVRNYLMEKDLESKVK